MTNDQSVTEVVYFHGGPGFNSNPERKTIFDRFADSGICLHLWNEPSDQRPGRDDQLVGSPFERYLKSAEQFFLESYSGKPQYLMAHSFGVHAVAYLLANHSEKIKKVIYITPAFSPSHVDRNVFTLVMNDYREHQDEKANDLAKVIEGYTGKFDENTLQGFMLVSQNPRFFGYYWFNQTPMGLFASGFAEAGFSIDANGFISVRQSWLEVPAMASSVPAVGIFGRHDLIISNEIEKSILRSRHKNLIVYDFERSAHYPQVEEAEKMLAVLKQEIQSTERVDEVRL